MPPPLVASRVARAAGARVVGEPRRGYGQACLAGIAAAQALGLALDRPVVGVNHIEAHLVAAFLAEERDPESELLQDVRERLFPETP